MGTGDEKDLVSLRLGPATTINDQYVLILEELGGFGFFQKTRLALLLSISFFYFMNFTTIFTLAPVNHQCYIPTLSHINQTNWDTLAYPESDPSCKRYMFSSDIYGNITEPYFTSQEVGCDTFVKNHDEVKSSATSDFELFCDRKLLQKVCSAAYFVGMGFGAIIFGYLADVIGRRPMLIFCMFVNAISVAANSVSMNFYMFILCRVLVGMSWPHYLIAFTIAAEMVIPKNVPTLGFLFETFFGLGLAFLGYPVAYYFRNWRSLEVISGLIGLLGAIAAIFTSESLRWLITKGYTVKAIALAEKMASSNSINIDKTSIRSRLKAICDVAGTTKDEPDAKPLQNLYIIVTTPCLCRRIAILSVGWAVNSLMYYAFTLNPSTLIPGNLYTNVVIGGLLEAPAMIVAYLLVDVIGRKKLLVGAYVMAGISCAMVGFTYENFPLISQIAGQSGKMCITLTFGVIYVYTLELVPTCIRATGMSVCSSMSRVGSISSPFIALMSEIIWFPLTYVVFTFAVLVTAILTLFLPETSGRPLQDTIDDAINFTKQPITIEQALPTKCGLDEGQLAAAADEKEHVIGSNC